MKNSNIFCVTIAKHLEVLFLFALALKMTFDGADYFSALDKFNTSQEKSRSPVDGQSFIASILQVSFLITAWFHFFHHQLLVNIRLAIRLWSPMCFVCWKPVNALICKFGLARESNGLQHYCSDRMSETIGGKYLVLFFMGLITQIVSGKFIDRVKDSYNVDYKDMVLDARSALMRDIWIFILQHVVFVAFRLGMFTAIQLCCLGCICSDEEADLLDLPEHGDRENFDRMAGYIISLQYEEHMSSNRRIGDGRGIQEEIQVQRELRNIRRDEQMASRVLQRQQSLRNPVPQEPEQPQSMHESVKIAVEQSKMVLAKEIEKSFRLKQKEECAICQVEFQMPCEVSKLACNSLHFFHSDCCQMWLDHTKSKGLSPSCPLCREVIDESRIVKKEYHGLTVSGQQREKKEKEMMEMPSELKKVVESHEDVFEVGLPNPEDGANLAINEPVEEEAESFQTEEVQEDEIVVDIARAPMSNAVSSRQMGSRREGEVVASNPPSRRAVGNIPSARSAVSSARQGPSQSERRHQSVGEESEESGRRSI